MHEKQSFKVLEFTNCIIGGFHGLLALKSTYTNTNMGCVDHVNIIRTITDSKCRLFRVSVLNHQDNFCLLFWTNSAR